MGGNASTYHASSIVLKYDNIDPTTVPFFWTVGPWIHVHIYADSGCGGLSEELDRVKAAEESYMPVSVNYNDGFQRIKSIKMSD
jgi:hypothetical protein